MKTLVCLMLSIALYSTAQDRKISIHDPNFKLQDAKDYDYITDEYLDKFIGEWLWQADNETFKIILKKYVRDYSPILKFKHDMITGWIQYKKHGQIEANTINNHTFDNRSIEGISLTEYELDVTIWDKKYGQKYKGSIIMDKNNPDVITFKILHIIRDNIVNTLKSEETPKKKDKMIHFPRTMIMHKIK